MGGLLFISQQACRRQTASIYSPRCGGGAAAARHFCPASRALVFVFIGHRGRGDVAGCRLFPSRRQERRRRENGHRSVCAGGGAGGMLPRSGLNGGRRQPPLFFPLKIDAALASDCVVGNVGMDWCTPYRCTLVSLQRHKRMGMDWSRASPCSGMASGLKLTVPPHLTKCRRLGMTSRMAKRQLQDTAKPTRDAVAPRRTPAVAEIRPNLVNHDPRPISDRPGTVTTGRLLASRGQARAKARAWRWRRRKGTKCLKHQAIALAKVNTRHNN